ncbi:MAG: Ig-like domain repeat protein [Terracidiphilus sp.]
MLDSASNLYIADTLNNRVRLVAGSAKLAIESVSPPTGLVGTAVTIGGTGFGATQGTSTVMFNGTAATSISNWSNTSIVTTVPAGATSGNLVVAVSGSTSNGVLFQVLPTLSVTTSGTPSTYGDSVTFTATISSGPTGTITFYDGGVSIGIGTISGTEATFTTNSLAVGVHAITAGWASNASYGPVTSLAITQTVNKTTPTISLSTTATGKIAYGTAVTITVTVTPSIATGSVTFTVGSTSLGSATLTNGIASFTTSTLPAGSDTITALYSGDSNDFSSSGTLGTAISVGQPTATMTLTTTAGPNGSTVYGTQVTITASITPSATTGSVKFSAVSSLNSTPISLISISDQTSVSYAGGVATFTTAGIPAGSPTTITATYLGGGNSSAAPATVAITIQPATLTITAVNSVNMPYGGPVPSIISKPSSAASSYTIDGIQNNDPPDQVYSGTPTLSLPDGFDAATAAIRASYPITVGVDGFNIVSKNYVDTATLVNGTLQVVNDTPTVTLTNTNPETTSQNPPLVATYGYTPGVPINGAGVPGIGVTVANPAGSPVIPQGTVIVQQITGNSGSFDTLPDGTPFSTQALDAEGGATLNLCGTNEQNGQPVPECLLLNVSSFPYSVTASYAPADGDPDSEEDSNPGSPALIVVYQAPTIPKFQGLCGTTVIAGSSNDLTVQLQFPLIGTPTAKEGFPTAANVKYPTGSITVTDTTNPDNPIVLTPTPAPSLTGGCQRLKRIPRHPSP